MATRWRWQFRTGAIALALLACACGSTPKRPTAATGPQLRSMEEARALELIDGWLTEAAYIGRPGWVVKISRTADLDVDLRLGGSQFGIEWVSDEDRVRHGKDLPSPAPDGQLRLLRASDGSQVLILDHLVYRTSQESTLDRSIVLNDAEVKLRRDVMDFIAYVNSQ